MSDYHEGNSDYAFDQALLDEEIYNKAMSIDLVEIATSVLMKYEFLDDRFKNMQKCIAENVLKGRRISEKQEKCLRNCYYVNYHVKD